MLLSWKKLWQRSKRRSSLPLRQASSSRTLLSVEALEARDLMSTIPAPLVSNQRDLLNGTAGFGNSPQVAIDPVNPNKLVAVYNNFNNQVAGSVRQGSDVIQGAYSTTGGATWNSFSMPINLKDPNFPTDPTGGYLQSEFPSVAFDRSENVYVVYTEHDAANTSGALVLQKFAFTGGVPALDNTIRSSPFDLHPRTLSHWDGQDPVWNPIIAVDTNLPTSDPTYGASQGDPLSGTIYVAWNTSNTAPSGNAATNFNPNTIKIIASADGGANFTTEQYVNDGSFNPNYGNERDSAPQIAFTQGSVNGNVPSGVMTVIWNNFATFANGGNSIKADSSQPADPSTSSVAAAALVATDNSPNSLEQGTNTIIDAGAGPTNSQTTATPTPSHTIAAANTTQDTLNFNSALITSITSVTVTLDINTTTGIDGGYVLALIAPNGTQINLATNRGGGGMNFQGTLFTDANTATPIASGSAPFNSPQGYNPETGSQFSSLNGKNPNGNWTLKITNSNGVVGILNNWSISVTGTGASTVSQTTFQMSVNLATVPNFTTIDDLDVTLNMVHPHLDQVQILLTSPGGRTVTLVRNGVDNKNTAIGTPPQGIKGANLGVVASGTAPNFVFTNVGTVFDQQAPRSITDTGAAAPFTAHFRPEGAFTDFNSFSGLDSGGLNAFNGLTTANGSGSGLWTLTIRDYVSDGTTPPVQFLSDWSINFTSGISTTQFGGDTTVIRRDPADAAVSKAPVVGAVGNVFPLKTPSSPIFGVGPAPVLAVDNTLGALSPNQGRIYLAYTGTVGGTNNNTDIYLITSDDGGASWSSSQRLNDDSSSDNFSEGNRTQFMPALAVDPATGTLAATFYDARYDAANVRLVTTLATSIDGGDSFTSQTTSYLNLPKTAIDTITGKTVVLEPIPSNQTAANTTFGFGTRQGLVFNSGINTTANTKAGNVVALWAGNLNTTSDVNLNRVGDGILTATVRVAAGPRIVQSDMGPVVNDFTDPINATLYNNTFAADGTRQINGFVVVFDRPVDPSTFDASDVQVFYRSTDPTSSAPGIAMNVTSVTPLDGGTQFGAQLVGGGNLLATTFLIGIIDPSTGLPPSRTGTYSYTIGPNISDAIPTAATVPAGGHPGGTTGNFMDQNANAVTNEVNRADPANPTLKFFDAYSTPASRDPLHNPPLKLPYDQDTLPLIIPGPHVVGVNAVTNGTTPILPSADGTNLVLNSTVNGIDVTFDRDINASTFTTADIVRIEGPIGKIFDKVTDPAFVGTVTPLGPRSFRITGSSFPTQTLSGSYTVVLSSDIQAVTGIAGGDKVDTNLNAGVDIVRGGGPNSPNAPQTFANATPSAIPANTTISSSITVPSSFVIQGATLKLNITFPKDSDLAVTLTGPDNQTIVTLFTGVGGNGANFGNLTTDTGFDDSAIIPIQLGAAPFTNTFNPNQPLSQLKGLNAAGTFTLRITNSGSSVGILNHWSLTLLQPQPGSGLGEPVADQITAHFRIFTADPLLTQPHLTWTPVGPAAVGTNGQSGRIGGLALDPSDPSGNTVYVGGASGGVWKTTNFLTTDFTGPTYIQLTDLGPTFAMNIGGLAVFGRNSDPNQSIVFAATGEGDTGTQGVGFLRSMNGGATWTVLDSTTNVDSSGNLLPLNSSQRDHKFVGTTSFKVVVDPKANLAGKTIIYAALSGPNGGIWASFDTGDHWQLLLAGQATDIQLSPTSADASGNLQIMFAGIRGVGVFMSVNQGAAWNLMAGGVGDPLIRDGTFTTPQPAIPVNPNTNTPNGAKGRIELATPFATGNPLQDIFYRGWLYAVVVTTDNRMDGLYLTKDFGANWTKIRLPLVANPAIFFGAPTNDELKSDYDPLAPGSAHQGNYDVSLAIDPTNPNVVYLGGTRDFAPRPAGGFIRVDVTGMKDPYSFYPFDNSDNDGGLVQVLTQGGMSVGSTDFLNTPYGIVAPGGFKPPIFKSKNQPYLNLTRDPTNPFLSNATVLVTNVTQFNNDGTNASWMPFNGALAGSTDQHRLITFVDPLTGHARLIFGDDQGVFTGVDDGSGGLITGIGTAQLVTGSRNGNLQITQFYYSAAQPSLLASEIAGALFFANTQDMSQPVSRPDILSTGDLVWGSIGSAGDGTGIATDATGSGNVFMNLWAETLNTFSFAPTDFFQVMLPGAAPIGRTQGLLQVGDDPQWPDSPGENFAVNPIDPGGTGLAMSSMAGRIFRSTNQGVNWFPIGEPTDLDSTYAPALAFGSPAVGAVGNLDNFIYAGTTGGKIFVTFTGGGAAGSNSWKNISAGLDGSAVQQIVTNPARGSHEAYAVTLNGVYYMADSSVASPTWTKITGNLFTLTHNAFNDASLNEPQLRYLTTIQADWRTNGSNGPALPILYVGGEGGVFRSKDKGVTWTPFPSTADGAAQNGGYLPDAHITSLSLAIGNINSATGTPDQSGGPNVLFAGTYGHGGFVIRLDNNLTPGPRVIAVSPSAPVSPSLSSVTLTFSGAIDPSTFTIASIDSFKDPLGGTITPTAVTDITSVPSGTTNPHNVWQITFPVQSTAGVYTLIVGPNITDNAGNKMNQNQNTVNGEPGTGPAGDEFTGQFVIGAAALNTTTTLQSSAPSSSLGQSVTFTATITAPAPGGAIVQTGTVTFTDGATTLAANVPLNNLGQAVFTTTTLTQGGHTITATYSGTPNFNPSSASLAQSVAGAATTTVFTVASPNPATFGQTVTFTVSVTSPRPGAITGTVTFTDTTTGAVLGSPALSGGLATVTTSALNAGVHTIVATFNGNTVYGSSSGTVNETVNGVATSTTIVSATPNPANAGQTVTITISVTSSGGTVNGGTVTVFNNGSPIGTASVVNGQAVFSSTLPFSTNFITVSFGGTGNFGPSSAATGITVTVNGGVAPPTPPGPASTNADNPKNLKAHYIVAGADAGGGPDVRIFDATTGAMRFNFFAFDSGFRGGVRVGMADVSGDGFPDIIVGPGPGGGPNVRVYSGIDGHLLQSFFAYDAAFAGGIYVAGGDVNADGIADIIVGADAGGGPNIRVFNGRDDSMMYSYFAYDPGFTGGVRVGAGDVNGDGYTDILVGAGPGGGPNARAYSGRDASLLSSFFAYDINFHGGIYIAGGDVNGDGISEIITGPGFGGGPDVRAFTSSGQLLTAFLAFAPDVTSLVSNDIVQTSGARVGSTDVHGGTAFSMLAVQGPGTSARVRAFDLPAQLLEDFFAYDPLFRGGVFIAGK